MADGRGGAWRRSPARFEGERTCAKDNKAHARRERALGQRALRMRVGGLSRRAVGSGEAARVAVSDAHASWKGLACGRVLVEASGRRKGGYFAASPGA